MRPPGRGVSALLGEWGGMEWSGRTEMFSRAEVTRFVTIEGERDFVFGERAALRSFSSCCENEGNG